MIKHRSENGIFIIQDHREQCVPLWFFRHETPLWAFNHHSTLAPVTPGMIGMLSISIMSEHVSKIMKEL
jgi:hypothetical protein